MNTMINTAQILDLAFQTQSNHHQMSCFERMKKDKGLTKAFTFENKEEMKTFINGLLVGGNLLDVLDELFGKVIDGFNTHSLHTINKRTGKRNQAYKAYYDELYQKYDLSAFILKKEYSGQVILLIALTIKPDVENTYNLPEVINLVEVCLLLVEKNSYDKCHLYNVHVYSTVEKLQLDECVNTSDISIQNVKISIHKVTDVSGIDTIIKHIEMSKVKTTPVVSVTEKNTAAFTGCIEDLRHYLLQLKDTNPVELLAFFHSGYRYQLKFFPNIDEMKNSVKESGFFQQDVYHYIHRLFRNGVVHLSDVKISELFGSQRLKFEVQFHYSARAESIISTLWGEEVLNLCMESKNWNKCKEFFNMEYTDSMLFTPHGIKQFTIGVKQPIQFLPNYDGQVQNEKSSILNITKSGLFKLIELNSLPENDELRIQSKNMLLSAILKVAQKTNIVGKTLRIWSFVDNIQSFLRNNLFNNKCHIIIGCHGVDKFMSFSECKQYIPNFEELCMEHFNISVSGGQIVLSFYPILDNEYDDVSEVVIKQHKTIYAFFQAIAKFDV